MASEGDIENRINHIVGVIAPHAGRLNEALDPLIEMLKSSNDPELRGLRMMVAQDPRMAKLDLLTSAAELLAHVEFETGGRYADEQLLDKIHQDLTELVDQVAHAQRGPQGRSH